jgi:chromosome segregation ATPase
VNQLDEMVLAVGKRVVGMDASMESVGAVQEALQALLLKQEAIAALQVKIDARLDEAIKSTQGMPELTAKQVDLKTQAMSQQVTAMDGRLKAQAGALSTLSSQMKGLQGALGDSGVARREMEAQLRKQRESQNADAAATSAAAAAAATAVRNRERMLQYPRAQPADKP